MWSITIAMGCFVGVHGAGCRWSGKTVEVWDKGGKRATKGNFVVDGGVKGYRGLRREVTTPCTCLACSTSGGWCGGGILDHKCVAIRRLNFTPSGVRRPLGDVPRGVHRNCTKMLERGEACPLQYRIQSMLEIPC